MNKTIYSYQAERLREWLKQSRIKQRYTMRSIAQKIEVPHSWVQKIENGERRLDVIEYIKYCRALDVDPFAGLEYTEKFNRPEIKKVAEELVEYN